MTSTLVPTSRATPSSGREVEEHQRHHDQTRPQLTAVVLDESSTADVESILSAIGDMSGATSLVVTRHPMPPCVLGPGAGTEATMMWNTCHAEWRSNVDTTADRLRTLRHELRSRGVSQIESIDCFPRWHLFRSLHRREMDGLVRALERLDPDRIVIDSAHHLGAELHEVIAKRERIGARLDQAVVEEREPQSPPSPISNPPDGLRTAIIPNAPACEEVYSAMWIDLGGSE